MRWSRGRARPGSASSSSASAARRPRACCASWRRRRVARASSSRPNEDVQQAIVRMFLRLRAPRIARAEVAWPAPPLWQTPLPSGLFGGETLHAMPASPPRRSARRRSRWCPMATGPRCARRQRSRGRRPRTTRCRASLRRAGSRRWTTPRSSTSRCATGLLTDRTNLLVVAERAAGEKARDLPDARHRGADARGGVAWAGKRADAGLSRRPRPRPLRQASSRRFASTSSTCLS